jgi:hypothetical protein
MKKGHAGLVQKKVSVKTKGGKTVQRSMWVRAGGAARAAGSFLNRHKGKIAGAAALAGAAVLAHKHGGVSKAAHAIGHAAKDAVAGARAGAKGAHASWKLTGAMNKMAKAAGSSERISTGSRVRIAAQDGRTTARMGRKVSSLSRL